MYADFIIVTKLPRTNLNILMKQRTENRTNIVWGMLPFKF